MEIKNEKVTKYISKTKVLMDGGYRADVKLETDNWGLGKFSSELTLPGVIFSDLEISQIVMATLKLVSEQRYGIDDEIIDGLEEACLEFLGAKEQCCHNPQPSNAYVNSTAGRLKSVIVCDNCGSILEEEQI